MARPTRAPAQPLTVSATGDNPPNKVRDNLATLAVQAADELSAVREACLAAAGLENLLVSVPTPRSNECLATPIELRALVALINAEFERRIQAVKATIASMQ